MASFITLSTALNIGPSASSSILTEPAPITAQTLKELVAEKAEAAGVDKDLALKIAYCESTFRQFNTHGVPLRGLHNPGDVGLFQINEDFHAARSQALGYDIYSTEGNVDYAVWLLKNEGSKPWNSSRSCWHSAVA